MCIQIGNKLMPDDGSESVAVLSEEKNLDPEMKLILKQIGDFRTMQKELEDQRAENQEKYRIDTLRRLQEGPSTTSDGGDADKTDDAARIDAEKAELEKVLAEASADAGSSKRDEKDGNKDKDRKRRERSPERSRRDRDRDRDRSRRDRSGSRTRDRRRRRRSRDRSRGRHDDRKRSKRSKKDTDASTDKTSKDSPVTVEPEPAAPPAPKPVGFTLTTKKKSFSLDVPVGAASFQHIDSAEAAKPSRPIIPIDYTAEVCARQNGVPHVSVCCCEKTMNFNF